MKKSRLLCAAGAALLLPLLLIRSADAAQGAYKGILLCGGTLIPALFPFMAAAELFSVLVPVRRRFSALAAVFFVSAAGGYPAGARCASRLFQRGLITRRDAGTLVLSCFNAAPSFAITAVGAMLLNSRDDGLLLWAINLASCIVTAAAVFTLRGSAAGFGGAPACVSREIPVTPSHALSSALSGMMSICGCTVLFSSLLSVLRGFTGDGLPLIFISAVCEVTNGCLALCAANRLSLVSACLGLGGVCVWVQNLSFASGLGIHPGEYAAARLFQAVVSFTLAMPFSRPLYTAVFASGDPLSASFTAYGVSASVGIFILTAVTAGLLHKLSVQSKPLP